MTEYMRPCPLWADKLAMQKEDLSLDDLLALTEHLKSCLVCQQTSKEYNDLNALFDDLPIPGLPEGLPPRLLALWEQEESRNGRDLTSDFDGHVSRQNVGTNSSAIPIKEATTLERLPIQPAAWVGAHLGSVSGGALVGSVIGGVVTPVGACVGGVLGAFFRKENATGSISDTITRATTDYTPNHAKNCDSPKGS